MAFNLFRISHPMQTRLLRLTHVWCFCGFFFCACCASALPVGSVAAAERFAIDATHTIPNFEVMHFGMTTQRGRFDRASGWVVLDVAAQQGSVSLSIDTRSIDIGSAAANRLLRSAAMLDVTKFPTIEFRSEQLHFDGARVIAADGRLTVAGVTRSIRVTVSGFACGPHPLVKRRMCGGDISATLRRSDFGLTKFLPDIGDVVRIEVPVESLAEPVASCAGPKGSCP